MKRKLKIIGVLFLILSAMVFLQVYLAKARNTYEDRILFGYSENAKQIAIHFMPSTNEGFDEVAQELKMLLVEQNANLYTFPNANSRGMGVYVVDKSIVFNQDESEILDQLEKNKIMVLQDSIVDKYSEELVVASEENGNVALDFNNPQFEFNSDYSLAVEGIEYIYNFFDSPYFNGYFIIDSVENPGVPEMIVNFFSQKGFYSYTIDNGLVYEGKWWEFVYYSHISSVFFIIIPILFLLYIANTIVVINHILKQENEGMLIRKHYGASFIGQLLRIGKLMLGPLLIASGSWILLLLAFNSFFEFTVAHYLTIFIVNVCYIILMFFTVFAFQYFMLKIKQEIRGNEV